MRKTWLVFQADRGWTARSKVGMLRASLEVTFKNAPVAQLDRVLVSEASFGRGKVK